MSDRDRRWPWWLILTSFISGGLICAGVFNWSRPEPETVYLPSETVEVRKTSDIIALANKDKRILSLIDDLEAKDGELRDVEGRLAEVVQTLSVETTPTPAPAPDPIIEYIREECPEAKPPAFEYRASVSAAQFRGLDVQGDLSFGWRGKVACLGRIQGAPDWLTIHEQPFTLENTQAATTLKPEAPRRPQRWYLGMHYSLLTESSFSQYEQDPYTVFVDRISVSDFRAYGGRIWLPKKRISIRTGIFAGRDAAGLDLSFSW